MQISLWFSFIPKLTVTKMNSNGKTTFSALSSIHHIWNILYLYLHLNDYSRNFLFAFRIGRWNKSKFNCIQITSALNGLNKIEWNSISPPIHWCPYFDWMGRRPDQTWYNYIVDRILVNKQTYTRTQAHTHVLNLVAATECFQCYNKQIPKLYDIVTIIKYLTMSIYALREWFYSFCRTENPVCLLE